MDWQYIILHHSFTEDSQTLSWGAIRRYHTDHHGWSDCGYHFGIEDVYGEYEVLVGRPLTRPGAHCKHRRMNTRAIGICFVGNYDERKPEMDMILTCMNRIILPLCKIYDIPYNHILGHREVLGVKKSCPGDKFDMNVVRELVRHELK
jgi:N-acetylmuramoyl-L-alanine amidase